MADFFGATTSDGRSEPSMVDSIMMPILHSAMNRAHEKVRSRDGVLQRLSEQSKFCDLAVMQLDACVSCLQSADDDRGFNRDATAYRQLVSDLTEIRARLSGRLKETERAIADKDKELHRLRNYVRSHRSRKDGEKEHSKEEKNIPEEKKKSKSGQDCDHMGSEINSLKRTLDVAMLVMQSAISVPEVRPCDLQFCSEMEKEIMTTVLAGFVSDFQFRLEEESVRSRENWSPLGASSLSGLMDELLSMRTELESLSESIAEVDSRNSSPRNRGKGKGAMDEFKDDGINKVSIIIGAHESIIKNKRDKLDELQRCIQGFIEKLDILSKWNDKMDSFSCCDDKSPHHANEISSNQPTLEYDKCKSERSLREKDATELDLQVEITTEIQSIVLSCMMKDFQEHMHDNDIRKFSRAVNNLRGNENEELNLHLMITGEIQSILLKCSMNDFQQQMHDQEMMGSIREGMCMDLLHETIKNEMNKYTEKMNDQLKHIIENCTHDTSVREELFEQLYASLLKETANTRSLHEPSSAGTKGNSSFIENLDSLLCSVEEENLALGPSSDNKEQDNVQFIVHGSEQEVLMIEENDKEMDLDSTCEKFRKALMQLGTSKMLLKDLGSEHEVETCDDDTNDSVRSPYHQRESSTVQLKEETKGSKIDHISDFASSLGDLTQLIDDLEKVMHQKLDYSFVRIGRLKGKLLQLVRLVAPLKKQESLYRQAFIRRCENLQKAEAEVDILGDQVNDLWSLLERIYAAIKYHEPALQQCSGVLNIMPLIRKELYGVTA